MIRKIGNIRRAIGFRGDIQITDVPSAVMGIKAGSSVLIGYSEKFSSEYLLRSMKANSKGAIINLEGIDNEIKVAELKEKAVFAAERDIIRKNSVYFDDELCGCQVITDSERSLGTLSEIWKLPANDVWLISAESYNLPYPAVESFIISIDKTLKRIKVKDFSGLDDLKEMRK